ncbi:MAG: rhodanese-like domain-containing protein, partial [Candidatus Aenigmatarchaeota archaeon]
KKIGIYEIKAPEICQIEKYPTTKPKYEIVIEELNKLNINFEEEVKNVYELKGLEIKEFNFNLPSKEKLIVLRTENIENFNFEKDKKYLLVCKTGMLSKYFAEKLRSQGIEAYWLDEKTAKRLGYLN